MLKIIEFLKKERLYVFIILFIISIQLLSLYSASKHPPFGGHKHPTGHKSPKTNTTEKTEVSKLKVLEDDTFLKEKLMESIAKGESIFAIVVIVCFIMGVIFSFLVGLCLLLYFLIRRLKGDVLPKSFIEPQNANWDILDVFRVSILFVFFGYSLYIAEAFLLWLFRIRSFDGNLFALVNTLSIDVIGFAIILYFVIKKYKQNLFTLGITFKSFLKSAYTGILGYLSFIPILVFIFVAVIAISNLLNYKPEPQPIFEILFEEKRKNVLTSLIILISIIGPIAEEAFFRGFAYTAFKKKMGVVLAAIITSAIFALLHANVVGFFPIMGLGLLLTYLYEKSGSLIPSITVHIIHNSALAIFMLAIKELAGML